MKKFNLKRKLNIYFIGIGGISMSAIAVFLYKNGFNVSGSDILYNENISKLEQIGIYVNNTQVKENISKDIDYVVYSKAIHLENEEYKQAEKLNLKILSRSELLGMIMLNFKKRICISGTHGKTTTTALIGKTILDMKYDPTINVGGNVDYFGGNYHIGQNYNYFIAEACEYKNSFLDFCPNIAVVTNIELDHTDFFKDIADVRNSFSSFVSLLPDDGFLVINNKIDDYKNLVKNNKLKIYTFGDNENANYYYQNAYYDKKHNMHFDVYKNNEYIGQMQMKLIGKHNILNFLACFATLENIGFEFSEVKSSLQDFTGVRRRLENKGVINGVTYIDDYAHHPTEIKASIDAVKELNYNNLYVVFQPHTFSRTKGLFDQFVDVLKNVDNVILSKIYSAREEDQGIITSNDLKLEIEKSDHNDICEYFDDFMNICKFLRKNTSSGDIVLLMGAGDIYKIYDLMKEKRN